mgnify:CR=1 FL=1
MIEAVRISRAAYPNRLRNEYFVQRFSPLVPAAAGDATKMLTTLLPEGGYCCETPPTPAPLTPLSCAWALWVRMGRLTEMRTRDGL